MKTLLLAIGMIIATVGSAYADFFQFVDRSGNYYLRNWAVSISGQPCGYTDGYGRIRIDRQHGSCSATLSKRGKTIKTVDLRIDGNQGLKVVSVP